MFVKACFDVRYSSIFWKRMNEVDKVQKPEFFSIHLSHEKRAKYLEDLIPIVQFF